MDSKTPKVELHVHLDGCVRPQTILDLAKKRGVHLPSYDVTELARHCRPGRGSLEDFLACFAVFMPTLVGDVTAIERIAYEFCEDSALQGVIYSEVRYSPHLLRGDSLDLKQVVCAVNAGLKKGCQDFHINVKSLLCCCRHEPRWSSEVLDLCVEFAADGVVGIDLACDEASFSQPTNEEHIRVFKLAKEYGVHRTVHAGESGPACNVAEAVNEMYAERIGHGYHTLEDPQLYKMLIDKQIHFEICPYSSYETCSIDRLDKSHPVVRICKDGGSFSINTDDTTLTGHSLSDEYQLLRDSMGLSDKQLAEANINAAQSSFLPPDEKQALITKLKKAYILINLNSVDNKE